jgi:hypothetical protein
MTVDPDIHQNLMMQMFDMKRFRLLAYANFVQLDVSYPIAAEVANEYAADVA